MTDLQLLWVIQLAPLVAFLLILLLPRPLKPAAPALGVLFSFAAAAAALDLLITHGTHGPDLEFSRRWLEVGGVGWIVAGFLIDPLNLVMIALVTSISFFVQLFSVYYMNEDRDRPRYFSFLSFFSFSMTGLVLSNNLFQTFCFWELVGLTSYLLIGFWFEKPAAATAARKAFVINRLGDLGFYLGVILLFLTVGSLSFAGLKIDTLEVVSPPMLTVIGLLVFMGVMGKSAQFPFHVWLPDAMEGPTPVSALIHSATMVAAGVFLLARSFELFAASAVTLSVILFLGFATAVVSAFLATVQNDIKRILAYSTVSQLGLMTMAIGAGSPEAGMFHLSTHAYFKSLLFLTAGVFIHRCHSNDIREIARAGGRRQLLPAVVLLIGVLSLCGVFPFSGFFSKDQILEVLKERSFFYYLAAAFVSLLTAYYSFRLIAVVFFSRLEEHAHPQHPEPAWLQFCMGAPLVSLAALSVYVGWSGHHAAHVNWPVVWTATGVTVAGGGFALWRFRDPDRAAAPSRGWFGTLLANKFYIDDAYAFIVKGVGLRLAALLQAFDKAFPNRLMVDRTSFGILRLGRVLARIQNGLFQDYVSVALGAAVLALAFALL